MVCVETDRPNLGEVIFEQIEVEMHQVDVEYWKLLRTRQGQAPTQIEEYRKRAGIDEPTPPLRPQLILMPLDSYAQRLFIVEAYKHPKGDPNSRHWLLKLAERVEARIMKRLGELESSGAYRKFAHHGVTEPQMREVVQKSLAAIVGRWPVTKEFVMPAAAPPILPVNPVANKSALLIMAEAAKRAAEIPVVQAPVSSSFAAELQRLLLEARIRPEDIAEDVGINERNVYRHLSGQTKPSLVNLGSYEKALSKRLGRPVKLPMPAKRQSASKTSAKRQ